MAQRSTPAQRPAQRIPTAVARKQFARIIEQSARGERIKLTRYDKTLAVIISKRDLCALEACEEATVARARRKK